MDPMNAAPIILATRNILPLIGLAVNGHTVPVRYQIKRKLFGECLEPAMCGWNAASAQNIQVTMGGHFVFPCIGQRETVAAGKTIKIY
jgi:hypothetical protein